MLISKYNYAVSTLIAVALVIFAGGRIQAAPVLFTPELIFSEEYSDNISLLPENGNEDFITTVALGLTTEILGRKSGLQVNLNPSYSTFAENSEYDYWRYAGSLRFWRDFSRRTHLEIANTFLETEDPRDDSSQYTQEDVFGEPAIGSDVHRQGRGRYRRNVSEADLTHQFGVNDFIFAGVQYAFNENIDTDDTLINTDILQNELLDDYTVWQPTLGLTSRFNPRWALSSQLVYSNRDYDNAIDREEYDGNIRLLRNFTRMMSGFVDYRHTYLDFAEEPETDYHVYSPSVGVQYQWQEETLITVGLGYYYQDFKNDEDGEQGVFINSELAKNWLFKRSTLTLVGGSGYDIDDTGSEDLGLNIYHRVHLNLTYNVTPRSAISAYAGFRHDEYPNETPERTDHSISAGGGVRWQALQWMSVGLNYDFDYRESDRDVDEYTENRVLLVIRMAPSSPYRW